MRATARAGGLASESVGGPGCHLSPDLAMAGSGLFFRTWLAA